MAGILTAPSPGAPASGSQQQSIIDAVARRQYGRWAVQYRGANVWAAGRRDAARSASPPTPPAVATSPESTPAQRLVTLHGLWESGVISDAEFDRLKAAVLA